MFYDDDEEEIGVIQKNSCGYTPIKEMGRGSYGVVYEVESEIGEVFAYKYLPFDGTYEIYGIENLIEIDILSRIYHPNIIHASKILNPKICNMKGIALLMPLGERTLKDLITSQQLTTREKLPILCKIAEAVAFLHQNGILHLDIKDTNVVINDGNPYLIDFGLSMYVENVTTGKKDIHERVTPFYRPPEIFEKRYIYNEAVDVWSLGILFLVAIYGDYIFDIKTILNSEYLKSIFSSENALDKYLTKVSPKYRQMCKDLLTKMLKISPGERISAYDVYMHPLFDEVMKNGCNGKITKKCEKFVLSPPISPYYNENHRDILKLIYHWSVIHYGYVEVEALYLSVDLFNRTASYYKDTTQEKYIILAATCLWMALKLTGKDIDNLIFTLKFKDEYESFLTASELLSTELEIVNHLHGILYVNRLYHACSNKYELMITFSKIILNLDTTIYSKINNDPSSWISQLKSDPDNSNSDDKNIKIKDLFN